MNASSLMEASSGRSCKATSTRLRGTFPTPSASSKLNTKSSAPSSHECSASKTANPTKNEKKSMSSEPPPSLCGADTVTRTTPRRWGVQNLILHSAELGKQRVQGTIVEAQVLLPLDDVAAQRGPELHHGQFAMFLLISVREAFQRVGRS